MLYQAFVLLMIIMIKSVIISQILIFTIMKWAAFKLFILIKVVGQNKNIINHSQYMYGKHLYTNKLQDIRKIECVTEFECLIVSNPKIRHPLALKNWICAHLHNSYKSKDM